MPPLVQSKFIREVGYHVKASFPCLYIVTDELERLYQEVQLLADTFLNKETKSDVKFTVYRWTITNHWQSKSKKIPKAEGEEMPNPNTDFAMIKDMEPFSIFIMENFHFYLTKENPELIAMVKDIARHCNQKNKTVIFANNVLDYPQEVEPNMTVMYHELPDKGDIDKAIDAISDSVKDKNLKLTMNEDGRHQVVKSLQGMRLADIENALAYSVVTTRTYDTKVLLAEKCKAVRKTGSLEYIESHHSFEQVGGYERAKSLILRGKVTLGPKAKKYNLDPPKGYLYLGVSGGGKSYFVGACGAELQLPVLRLDMGSMFGSLVGESEKNIRTALSIADSMAPCILWIDEWDKGMSGMGGSGTTDGGTTTRVGGKILQWMNDHTSLVIVMATANDIAGIPIEYMRKGRFNEIIFFDIPTNSERGDIFKKQIAKQKLAPDKFEIQKLIDASAQFTGAEIAAAISAAKLLAANRDEHPKTEDIVECLKETIPEAKKNKQKVESIRARAAQVAVLASEQEALPGEIKTGKDKWRNLETD